jgi:hypothetical protein
VVAVDDEAEVLHLWLFEDALGRFQEVRFDFQEIEDIMDYEAVSLEITPRGNQDVVHVDKEFIGVFVDKWSEHSCHSSAEGGGGVGEAEEHNAGLEESKGGFEGGFVLVLFSDADIFIPPPDVKLSEECLSLELFNDGVNEGEWVCVADGP